MKTLDALFSEWKMLAIHELSPRTFRTYTRTFERDFLPLHGKSIDTLDPVIIRHFFSNHKGTEKKGSS